MGVGKRQQRLSLSCLPPRCSADPHRLGCWQIWASVTILITTYSWDGQASLRANCKQLVLAAQGGLGARRSGRGALLD